MLLAGKTVVLCVTGGIAAYKAADLTSKLRQAGATVRVLMTESATQFISPITFETLSGYRTVVDTFDRNFAWEVEHISLAKAADVFVIAPATANIIAKAAHGIADDMVSTTLLATKAPVVIAPAMNTGMYDNPVTQQNFEHLACAGIPYRRPGGGTPRLRGHRHAASCRTRRRCCTASSRRSRRRTSRGCGCWSPPGPRRRRSTRCASCPIIRRVRWATPLRHARRCVGRRSRWFPVRPRWQHLWVSSAWTLSPRATCTTRCYPCADAQDIIIKAAAVGDYRPAQTADEKLKKNDDDLSVALVRNPDILAELGRNKRPGQQLCGFAMETQNLLENAADKLRRKNCDMLVANSLRDKGAGFGTDTNAVTLLFADGTRETPPLMPKEDVADVIFDRLLAMRAN